MDRVQGRNLQSKLSVLPRTFIVLPRTFYTSAPPHELPVPAVQP